MISGCQSHLTCQQISLLRYVKTTVFLLSTAVEYSRDTRLGMLTIHIIYLNNRI